MNQSELLRAEEAGAAGGWVSPLSQEDRDYFAYLRKVFKRCNITPSKATRLKYDFFERFREIHPPEKRAEIEAACQAFNESE